MEIRIAAVLLCAGLMGTTASVSAQAQALTPAAQEQVVREYISAFNAHDTAAMLRMVSDDVQWLSVDGDRIAVETGNKEELRRSMDAYFGSCGGCSAKLLHVFSTGTRVSALEQAGSSNDAGERAQSLSVYEFSDGLIRRVYYFPVEKRTDPPGG